MRKIILAAALLLAGCSASHITAQQPDLNKHKLVDHTITLTWNQSTVNNGFCSSTVTTSCISGFNEGYVVGTAQTQLHTDTPAVCSGTTQPLNCTSTFTGIVPIGNDVFYVVTTSLDQNGAEGVTTAALSPAVPVSADAAVNVKATVQ